MALVVSVGKNPQFLSINQGKNGALVGPLSLCGWGQTKVGEMWGVSPSITRAKTIYSVDIK